MTRSFGGRVDPFSEAIAAALGGERARLNEQDQARRDAARVAGLPEPRPRVVVDRFGRPR